MTAQERRSGRVSKKETESHNARVSSAERPSPVAREHGVTVLTGSDAVLGPPSEPIPARPVRCESDSCAGVAATPQSGQSGALATVSTCPPSKSFPRHRPGVRWHLWPHDTEQ